MSSIKQNLHIARLLVGAMSIDGSLDKKERQRLAKALSELGMEELLAYVGAGIEEDSGDFNMFDECKQLLESLGNEVEEFAPVIFRLVAEVVAKDRFVSAQEASYLSAMARQLRLKPEQSKEIFRSVMISRRGRLEVAASGVDSLIHPHLKELLSFEGAEQLVGELPENSLEEMLHEAKETLNEGCDYSVKDVEKALAVLGLHSGATLDEASDIWTESIETLNLPKMAKLGEKFVTAGLARISEVHQAYKTIHNFYEHLDSTRKAKNTAERLEKQIQRNSEPNSRNKLSGRLEGELTGIATGLEAPKD